MACCLTSDPGRRHSKSIDKEIELWTNAYKKTIKFLLLGAGESGKSTILKQMKILHIHGFTDRERQEKSEDVRRNILEAIKELTGSMGSLKPPEHLHDASNKKSLEYIENISFTESYELTQEFYDHVIRLWCDPGVQKTFNRKDEFSLIDSAKYFLDKIHVIRKDDYIPTDQDILHCRKKTSEIQRIQFSIKVPKKYGGGYQSFWMVDVGGQRGERRKWIQVFEGITAILFVVASSGFDLIIREDNETNRLQEALSLFQDLWKSRFLKESGFILFLNKQDQLKEKIEKGTRIEKHFPEYAHYAPKDSSGNISEYAKARCFIKDLFLAETRRESTTANKRDSYYGSRRSSKNRECFWHYTTATDTENVKKVFEDIHTMIVMTNLDSISPV